MSTYCSSYCNKPHKLSGYPVGHECAILPPEAVALERSGDFVGAIEAIDKAKPLRMVMPNVKITPHKSDKGYQLHDTMGRVVLTLVNPENLDYTKNNYILSFGAYGCTRLRVWEDDLDDALDTAAEWLKEHEPGHFHEPDYAEACKELGIPFDAEELSDPDGKYNEAINNAEADLTYTESGYLASFEWDIYCENPTRETLLALVNL